MGTNLKKLIAVALLPLLTFASWEMDFDELWATAGGWSNPYITDGLVAMWDGEWNAGGGKHNPEAVVWKDLIGDCDITLSEGFSFSTDELVAEPGSSAFSSQMVSIAANNYTCELLFACGTEEETAAFVNHWRIGNLVGFSFANYLYRYSVYWSGTRVFNKPATWNIGPSTPRYSRYVLATIVIDYTANTFDVYYNGELIMADNAAGSTKSDYMVELSCARTCYTKRLGYYNRALTPAEIAHNYTVDKARFGL